MKIGIDISQMVYETGVSVYTRNLVKNLLEIDKENEYVLFAGTLRQKTHLKKQITDFKGNFQTKIVPLPPKLADLLWNRLHMLPIETFTGKIDILHTSDWTQPPSKGVKIATVHDLSPLVYPKLTDPSIVSVHKKALKWIEKEAGFVIAPSLSTQLDLIELGIQKERIKVIPEAADPIFKTSSKKEIDNLRDRLKLSSKYLISVGANPRKNTDRIIEAFEKVKPGRDLKLIFVGENKHKLEESRGVRFLGKVALDDLVTLYSGAEALVYPSLYEGFGLPILEAFACGCPVVTSNTSSMPEVAGDAALLVNPNESGSISEGIIKVIDNRKEYIKKGFIRLKAFSWEKTAQETLKVYQEAFANKQK